MNGGRLPPRAFAFYRRLPTAFRLLGVNVVLAAATLLTSIVLARALEPEGRGVLATVILWPMLLSHLALMGLHLHLGRIAGQSLYPVGALYRHGLSAIAPPVLIITAAWVVVDLATPGWPVEEGINRHWIYILLCTSIIPFSAWNAFQVQVELGRGAFATYNFARTSFAIIHLMLIGVLWLAESAEPLYFLACFALAAALASLFSKAAIMTSCSARRSASDVGCISAPPAMSLGSTYRSAWPFAVSTATVAFMTVADRLLVSLFFDAHTMGLYVVAIAMTQMQGVVNEALAPLFYTRLARHATLEAADLIWLAGRTRQSVAINVAIASGLMLIAPILLPLIFGYAYAEAMGFVSILVPAMAIRSVMRPFEEILKGGNKPLDQAATIATMSIVFAVCGAVAAWFNSPQGVAVALLLANTAGLALVVRRVSLHMGISAGELLLPRPNDLIELTSEMVKFVK